MNAHKFIIRDSAIRARAVTAVNQIRAEPLMEVIIQEHDETRTSEQNDKMWPMLRDIGKQVLWDGVYLDEHEWKDLFTAVLRGQKLVRGIEGGLVAIGSRTKKLKVKEMADMIEYMYAFGAEKGVKWSEKVKGYEDVQL